MRRIVRKGIAVALASAVILMQNSINGVVTARAMRLGSLGILDQWQDTAPDYYCDVRYMPGVGRYFIYLKDNTEQNRKNVLDGVPEEMDVVFITCAYSRNELKETESDLAANLGQYPGVQSFGIGNADLESGRSEPRIVVGILKDDYETTSKKLTEKYGDRVCPYIQAQIESMPAPVDTDLNKPIVTPTVKIKSAKVGKKKITVRWKKIDSASKYRIVIVKKGGKNVLDKATAKTGFSYKTKGKAAKSYTIKVKAYSKTAKKWGAWTKRTIKGK